MRPGKLAFALILPACLVVLTCLPLIAQSYQLKTITFAGYVGASQAELLAASRLHAGDSVNQAGMNAAAQRLTDTGLFANAQFRFDGEELHFDLTPVDDIVPVRFENFAWWDDATLTSMLAARVPLFKGSLPPGSAMQARVIDALTALVSGQQVNAMVAASTQQDPTSGIVTGVRFRITSPSIQVGAVTFEGASAGLSEQLEAAVAKAALGKDFSSEATPVSLTAATRTLYRNLGYLEVQATQLSRRAPVLEGDAVRVPVTLTVQEGPQYRLDAIVLVKTVKGVDMPKTLPLKPGDVVNEGRLHQELSGIVAPLKGKGYMHAHIEAIPKLNREKQTAEYSLSVVPGDRYNMGGLEVQDLDDSLKAIVLNAWGLKAGDPYNSDYVQNFLKSHPTLHQLDGYSADFRQIEHLDTHSVDLVISFRKGGPVS
jgi:outer membrane protein assembly factor BamA